MLNKTLNVMSNSVRFGRCILVGSVSVVFVYESLVGIDEGEDTLPSGFAQHFNYDNKVGILSYVLPFLGYGFTPFAANYLLKFVFGKNKVC